MKPGPTLTVERSPEVKDRPRLLPCAEAPLSRCTKSPAAGGGEEFGCEGPLRITRESVTVVADGTETTLVWSSELTRWDASDQAIVLERADPRLPDGDSIAVSGGEVGAAADWLARPAEECPESLFLVSDIQRQS